MRGGTGGDKARGAERIVERDGTDRAELEAGGSTLHGSRKGWWSGRGSCARCTWSSGQARERGDEGLRVLSTLADDLATRVRRQARGQATRIRMRALGEAAVLLGRVAELDGGQQRAARGADRVAQGRRSERVGADAEYLEADGLAPVVGANGFGRPGAGGAVRWFGGSGGGPVERFLPSWSGSRTRLAGSARRRRILVKRFTTGTGDADDEVQASRGAAARARGAGAVRSSRSATRARTGSFSTSTASPSFGPDASASGPAPITCS